ncbi:PREDICTED: uncharacterized protein LOC108368219 [Rhagoletis zephyria]|uniref:uncharacterized protein LOC108368219 n=1 Tax=Rhagoletis zephyria TaxID=28612 RepID=UPI0008114B6B|nr:PREDICTED: uncharacterized protein LOC108368219 [Rhagoletis zephyria]
MIFQGFVDTTVTTDALFAKMRTLLKAYESAKDNERQTGTAPRTILYMTEMDEVFGESCLVVNNHTINLGTDPQGTLIETCTIELLRDSTRVSPIPEPSTSSQFQELSTSTQSLNTPTRSHNLQPSTPAASTRVRKTARDRYSENKLELKRRSCEEKEKFHADIQRMLQNLEKKRDLQLELEEKKLKIEEEKLKLLQQCCGDD